MSSSAGTSHTRRSQNKWRKGSQAHIRTIHFDQGLDETMSTANPNNTDDHSLKELRVALPKMKLAEGQNQPSTSSQALEAASTSAVEGAEKKLVESDGPKGQKKNKSSASGSDVKPKVQKGKMKPAQAETKEKESQKPSKSGGGGGGGEDAKKKPGSEEKKNKVEADKTNKQAKEKGNTPKGKAAEKKVNANQEKKNKNQEKKDKTPAGKGQNKEKKTPRKQVEVSHEFKEIKELLRDDPSLPVGWKRIIKGKHVGTELKPVVCIASPEGRKFYFKARLKEYLEKIKSPLTIDDFYFGLYERNEDKARNKSANARKAQTQKRKESIGQEHETKKIRLDSGGGSKKGRASKSYAEDKEKNSESSGEEEYEAGDKNLLLEDPDLPEGWVRKVFIKNDAEGQNKIQVCIISPDGRKFRRKNLLQKYLQKTSSPLDIDQFYFGIYPRKDGGETSQAVEQNKEPAKQGRRRHRRRRAKGEGAKADPKGDQKPEEDPGATKKKPTSPAASKSDASGDEPMLEDPNLPPGWRRTIKVRSAGESAGRMEVIISSPDGKRHRSRGALENYIKQKRLDLKADDFDFTVFGKNSKKYSAGPSASSPPKQKSEGASAKKKSSTSHASDSASGSAAAADADADEDDDDDDDDDADADTNDDVAGAGAPITGEGATRESEMINYVSALMLNCGLRDLRSERRIRVPKEEQEKVLKNYLDSVADEDGEEDEDEAEIPTSWVKKLAHCRSDFGPLEDDAAEAIASLTKDFLIRLTENAYKRSKDETKLEYNDLAAVIDEEKGLAPLRSLIPKKMTYKEYMKLNRPKKFTSFT